jgi:glycine/D-amino acid oxidase-like deaminating enzyme
VTYRERSLWLDGLEEPLQPRPRLAGDAAFDVAIVGAGLTGLWAAYHLATLAPDLRVAVLEREIAGFGPSGRNGGWAGAGIAGDPRVYARRHGADAVRRATAATERAVDEIAGVVASEGIACGFDKGGSLAVATTEPQRRRLLAGVAAAQRLGTLSPGDRFLEPREAERLVRIDGVRAAFYTPHCARVDPGRLTRGLALACERRGVTIFEQTPVNAIAPGRAITPFGTVTAGAVLRATESYTTQLPGQRRRFLPLYSLMIATEPLPDEVWDQLGWPEGLTIRDRRHLFFYAQRTPDGRIAIGGRGAPYRLREPISAQNERNARVRERLLRTLHRHFPAARAAAITHHWGGPLAVPRDWCMAVQFDPVTRTGSAGGYAGHGVVAARIGGRTLAELVLGRSSELTTLPWVGHRARAWEPEPLRYLASRAIIEVLGSADAHEDRTDRTARRAGLVAPFMPRS